MVNNPPNGPCKVLDPVSAVLRTALQETTATSVRSNAAVHGPTQPIQVRVIRPPREVVRVLGDGLLVDHINRMVFIDVLNIIMIVLVILYFLLEIKFGWRILVVWRPIHILVQLWDNVLIIFNHRMLLFPIAWLKVVLSLSTMPPIWGAPWWSFGWRWYL